MKKLILLSTLFIGTWSFSQTPKLIANINKNGVSTSPRETIEFNGKLYFSANTNDRGIELHEYDDSQPAGSKITLVDDIRAGSNSSNPRHLYVFDDMLYFSAYGTSTNIYKYDGTNEPIVAVNSVGNQSEFIEYKDTLYYGTSGKINGYKAGTITTHTINGAGGLYPSYLTVYNDTLYFIASDGSNNGYGAIWQYDGINPPKEVSNTQGSSSNSTNNATNLHVFKDKLYFSYQENTATGTELYSYDGSVVSLISDIYTGTSGSYPTQLTTYDDKLYFSARSTNTLEEIWVYDGVNTPTLLEDINTGNVGSNPTYLTVFDNKLYFSAQGETYNAELWVYDGTSTSLISEINATTGSNPSFLIDFNNALYFSADNGTAGNELMKYTGSGTPTVAEDATETDLASNPTDLIVFDGNLFFGASDGINGGELWKYDGTNTVLFSDITTGNISYYAPYSFAIYKDSLFFVSNNNIYRTDGVNEPELVQLNATITGMNTLTVVDDKLYFSAHQTTTGQELWVYDGTSASLVADLSSGSSNFMPEDLINVNGTLVFKSRLADDIYTYDGTGTPSILSPPSSQTFEDPRNFIVYNNTLFFTAEIEESISFNGQLLTQNLRKVFSTNGVNQPSIVPLLDHIVGVGELGVYKNELVFTGEEVQFPAFVPYFYTYNGSNFTETDLNGLWQEGLYTEVNDTLYFRAGNGAASIWSYVTGGTPELVSAVPGTATNLLYELVNYNGNLIFTADNGEYGRELWGIGSDIRDVNSVETEIIIQNTSSLDIYPNPAEIEITTEIGDLNIYNTTGHLILSTYSEGKLDVSHLETGLYIVHQNDKKAKLVIK